MEVHFDMNVRTVTANNKVEADRGRVAIERGPVVYCAEWADNDFDVYILSAYLTDSRYALEEKNAWLDKYLPELPQEQEFQQILSSGQKKRPQLFHMILHLLNLRFLCKYACSFPP